jgi:flavin reductase (DIM6/NTAB) family NADH-FMN oxidoreductase RutF
MSKIKFKTIEPKILYFGTPVALITTLDADGNANIGPMSSVWALGRTLMLGLETESNLTGANPIPEYKKGRYEYDADKFKSGGFTAVKSEIVKPPRIAECQLQFEAVFKNALKINDDPIEASGIAAVEVRVIKIHADEELIIEGKHINPKKWDPLIYNFRHYYGLGEELGKTFKAEV